MKIVLSILLTICWSASLAQDANVFYPSYDIEIGAKTMTFGTDVKLRTEPNTESEVLTILAIGTPITILAKTEDAFIYDGALVYWYKIKTNTKTGYILRSFISIYGETRGNQTFLFNTRKEDGNNCVQIRIAEKDKPLIDHIYQLDTDEFRIEVYGNRGLSELTNVLYISYVAEACGVNGGGIYLFYDGENLTKALETTEMGDGDLLWLVEELIFPDDETEEKTLENKVHFSWEQGEKVDEDSEWTKVESSSREHSWIEGKWVPAIRER